MSAEETLQLEAREDWQGHMDWKSNVQWGETGTHREASEKK